MKHKIKTVTVKTPFLLRWTRRFIKLEIKEHNLDKLKGQKIDCIFLDEYEEVVDLKC